MKRFPVLLFVLLFSFVTVCGNDAKDRREQLALARSFETALSAAEMLYLHSVKNASPASGAQSLPSKMSLVQKRASALRKEVRVKSGEGVDKNLLWRWDLVRDLNSLLAEDRKKSRFGFRADLVKDSDSNTVLFVKRCIALDMQVPGGYHLMSDKQPREFRALQENQAAMQKSPRGKGVTADVAEWQDRVRTALFYFWSLHRSADAVIRGPEIVSDPANFTIQQAEDVLTLASCAFHTPRDSKLAREFDLKLTAISNSADFILDNLQRCGGLSKHASGFRKMEKLKTIWRRWNGKTDYLFYFADINSEEDLQSFSAVLDAELPITRKYAETLKKAQLANEKKLHEAKYRRRKKNPDGGFAEPEKVKLIKVPPPKAPGDPFRRAVYEYNLAVFAAGGARWQDARDIEEFKKDLLEFVQIVQKFRKGVKGVLEEYPECFEQEKLKSRRGGCSGTRQNSRNLPKSGVKKKSKRTR